MRTLFNTGFVTPVAMVCLVVGGMSLVPQPRAEPAAGPVANVPSAPPVDIKDPRPAAAASNPADVNWGQFTVELFALLNLPAEPGRRGQPAANNRLAVDTATVWESFKNTTEIYRPDGSKPCPWETNCELPRRLHLRSQRCRRGLKISGR